MKSKRPCFGKHNPTENLGCQSFCNEIKECIEAQKQSKFALKVEQETEK